MITPRIAFGLSFLSVVVFIAVNVALLAGEKSLPKIQGIVIPEGRDIADFTLVNQRREVFDRQNLVGKWSLLSYGFTDCPDICPTTLSKLAVLKAKLTAVDKADDLQVLFYTVDPQRDTAAHLAEYIAFFHHDFTALTYGPMLATDHLTFERSLGIVAAITALPEEDSQYDFKGYDVSHGVVLYVINPKGKLQAIFKPKRNNSGMHYFESEVLLEDYLALRKYFG